ncbi:N-acylneuraminate cytidylyltransferase [Actinobacillus equuli]|nr:N-acylneuraminate cytidylyltransferase [Actinobacillus equuli]
MIWVDLYQAFCDQYGKLAMAFTTDGLHLNAKGYEN